MQITVVKQTEKKRKLYFTTVEEKEQIVTTGQFWKGLHYSSRNKKLQL